MKNMNALMIFVIVLLGFGIPLFFLAKGIYLLVRNDQFFPWLLEKYFIWAALALTFYLAVQKAIFLRAWKETLPFRDLQIFKQRVSSAMYRIGYHRPKNESGMWVFMPRTDKAGFPPFRMTVIPKNQIVEINGPKRNVERFIRAMRMSGSLKV